MHIHNNTTTETHRTTAKPFRFQMNLTTTTMNLGDVFSSAFFRQKVRYEYDR